MSSEETSWLASADSAVLQCWDLVLFAAGGSADRLRLASSRLLQIPDWKKILLQLALIPSLIVSLPDGNYVGLLKSLIQYFTSSDLGRWEDQTVVCFLCWTLGQTEVLQCGAPVGSHSSAPLLLC